MDFFEAMIAMKDGEKVRLKTWPEHQYIGVEEMQKKVFGENVHMFTPIKQDSMPFDHAVSLRGFMEHQWEVWGEDEDAEEEE